MAAVEHESILSDEFLRQLIAVGQVDILVGLPTLNNAATVTDTARAINSCFIRDFGRFRTVLINADAGSVDGTPELVRDASFTEGDVVQTSYALRTLHRVNAPYHGLPGKLAALRMIFAAAALTQAKALVIIDPARPATTRAQITDLITPVSRAEVEFLSPRHRRHPHDGTLITQLVRPLIQAVYRVELDEPLGTEFGCSGRFASHCLESNVWRQEAARFAIDLWLRTEAVANRFSLGQRWRAAPAPAATPTLREVVRQVFLSLVFSLRAHEAFWLAQADGVPVGTSGQPPESVPPAPEWDYVALNQQARRDIVEIRPLLEEILETPVIGRLLDDASEMDAQCEDELWVRMVYAFLVATSQQRISLDHLADTFVPLYLWRASMFMSRSASDTLDQAQGRLDALCETFHRLRPALASAWVAGK
jgi:hypothetical protein